MDSLPPLCNRLKYSFPSLCNITPRDLADLKWGVKQLIIWNIHESASLLNAQFENLQTLVERREQKLTDWRKMKSVVKEVKTEYESNYRTEFMRIVLTSLERIKWPRALEAFSDPMDDLLYNNDTFLVAVTYFLNVLYPLSLPDVPPSRKCSAGLKATPRTTPIKSPDKLISSPSMVNAINNLTVHHRENQVIQESSFSTIHQQEDDQSYFTTNHHHKQLEEDVEYTAADKKPYDLQSIELLLYQNELLSQQVRKLQESIRRRDDIEMTIGSLLHDVTRAMQEVADLGVSSSTTLPIATASAAGPSTGAGIGTIPSLSSSSSNSNWRGLASKLQQLEKQWQEAHRASRQSSIGIVSNTTVNRDSNNVSSSSNNRRIQSNIKEKSRRWLDQAAGVGNLSTTIVATNNTNLDRSSFLLDSPPNNNKPSSSGCIASNSSRSSSRARGSFTGGRMVSPVKEQAAAGVADHQSSSSATSSSFLLQRELAIFIHGIDQLEEHSSSTSSVFMREFEVHRQSSNRASTTAGGAQPWWIEHVQYCQRLQWQAKKVSRLLADHHTSASGVLQEDDKQQQQDKKTTSTATAVVRSHLDLLMDKIEEEIIPKLKKSPHMHQEILTLREAASREHRNLVKDILLGQQTLMKWSAFMKLFMEKLHSITSNQNPTPHKKAIEESYQQLVTVSKIMKNIQIAYQLAEESRIVDPQQAFRGGGAAAGGAKMTMISPIDALTRGLLGEEMASLMHSLRLHVPSISESDTRMIEFLHLQTKGKMIEQKILKDFIQKALGYHDESIDNTVDDRIMMGKNKVKKKLNNPAGRRPVNSNDSGETFDGNNNSNDDGAMNRRSASRKRGSVNSSYNV